MLKRLRIVAAAAVLSVPVIATANRTINVDLFDASAVGTPVSGTLSAFPAPQNGGTLFNSVPGNDPATTPLVDSTGAGTGISVAGSNPDFGNPDQSDGTNSGVTGFKDTLVTLGPGVGSDPTGLVTLSGLNPLSTFDLYLFGFFTPDAETRENALFTVNSLPSQGTTGALSNTAGFTLGEDYTVFSGVVPVGGAININWTDNQPLRHVGVFNGLQIVENTVPEPTSLGLIGIGGLGLLARRRKA